MRHLDRLKPKHVGQNLFAGLVTRGKYGGPAPARRHDGDAVPGFEGLRSYERSSPPTIGHDISEEARMADFRRSNA
jgi:hypothetical protein